MQYGSWIMPFLPKHIHHNPNLDWICTEIQVLGVNPENVARVTSSLDWMNCGTKKVKRYIIFRNKKFQIEIN